MINEDIIRMAKQAGGREARNPELYDCFIMSLDDLERLYHHAAAAEREACAQTARTAMLGAEWVLTERVMKSIRARGQA